MRWQFRNTGFSPGKFNMETDESLAAGMAGSSDPATIPLLRVYGWKPHAVSIGFHQRMEDFDLRALQRAGIDIVRRPTGGRAILHADEITYSVVMPAGGRSPREIYKLISAGLLASLQALGVEAQLADPAERYGPPEPDERDPALSGAARPSRDGQDVPAVRDDPPPRDDPRSVPCFSSSAKYEIQFDGRKLVGSAQRRYGGSVLQHGSLLLGPGHRRIVEFLSTESRHARPRLEADLAGRTIDAGTILNREVPFGEAARALKKGFELACGITFEEAPSTVFSTA